jgi:hypothetical protein
MKSTLFKWKSGECNVTREQILEAMSRFDKDYRGKVKDSGQGWFILQDGKRYPPKPILSFATGAPRNEFYGGTPTNKVLNDLGFEVREVDDEIPEEVAEEKTTFSIERDLQAALRQHIGQLESGLKVVDGGKEKVVPSGRIDIMAEDLSGTAVAIELKAGEADRDAVAQVLAYMGDLTDGGKSARGILVAGGFSSRAVAAASVVPRLRLKKYSFKFSFEDISKPVVAVDNSGSTPV